MYALDVTANNNLTGLMNAIDSSGAVVTASIGLGSVLSFAFGQRPVAIELNDNQTPANLVSSTNQGANANFVLNGISVTKPAIL
jgi:hypothetical protein